MFSIISEKRLVWDKSDPHKICVQQNYYLQFERKMYRSHNLFGRILQFACNESCTKNYKGRRSSLNFSYNAGNANLRNYRPTCPILIHKTQQLVWSF